MIPVPSGSRVWLATGHIDMHKGFDGVALDPALLPDDVDALRRLIVGMAREAVQADTLIEKLRFELARLKWARFNASSEKLGEWVKQLEPAIRRASPACWWPTAMPASTGSSRRPD